MKKYHYFSHDFGARSDIKIKKLIVKHGYQGYGIYWAIIEDLYSNANALQADYDTIAFDLRTNADLIKSIIEDFGLFKIKKDVISSDSVGRRLSEMNERSEKASKAANVRWAKDLTDASAMQAHSDSNAIKEKKGNKEKEIKKVGEQHLEILSKQHNLDLNYLRTQLAVADEYYQERGNEITYAKFDAWLTRDPQSRKNPQNPNKVEPPYYKRFS